MATRNRAVEDVNRARDVALKELFDAMSGQVAGATSIGQALMIAAATTVVAAALSFRFGLRKSLTE